MGTQNLVNYSNELEKRLVLVELGGIEPPTSTLPV